MKNNILLIVLFTFSTYVNAQVAIEKNNLNGTSALLDFKGTTLTNNPSDQETTNTNGIILPAVVIAPTFSEVIPSTINPQNGTFLFDKTEKMVRMFTDGHWINLTDTGSSDSIINNPTNETGTSTIIGSPITEAKGILVLESTDKALILPHIKNPHLSVKSPYPGMICYDTVSNSMAVYNGTAWSYWK